MTTPEHDELELVPVRKVWPSEAAFTTWLAENMDLLSREMRQGAVQALGVEELVGHRRGSSFVCCCGPAAPRCNLGRRSRSVIPAGARNIRQIVRANRLSGVAIAIHSKY